MGRHSGFSALEGAWEVSQRWLLTEEDDRSSGPPRLESGTCKWARCGNKFWDEKEVWARIGLGCQRE
jgi:hypothetical protein